MGVGRYLHPTQGFQSLGILQTGSDTGAPWNPSFSFASTMSFFFFPKWLHYLFLPLPEDMLIDFVPEGEKQKHQCDRETLIHCLSHMLPQGPNPQTFGLWDDAPTN